MFGSYLSLDFFKDLLRLLPFHQSIIWSGQINGKILYLVKDFQDWFSSQWVPETEKSAFNSFAISGGTFGSIITNPMCGQIIASLGWEAVFYITGSIGLVWCVVWVLLARDSPEVSRWGSLCCQILSGKPFICFSFISEEEKKYIIANRRFDDSKDRKDNVPMIPLLM